MKMEITKRAWVMNDSTRYPPELRTEIDAALAIFNAECEEAKRRAGIPDFVSPDDYEKMEDWRKELSTRLYEEAAGRHRQRVERIRAKWVGGAR
jgi:hypothetical protein